MVSMHLGMGREVRTESLLWRRIICGCDWHRDQPSTLYFPLDIKLITIIIRVVEKNEAVMGM